MNYQDLTQFARRYGLLVASGVLSGLAVALVISLLQPAVFQSTAKVFVSTSQASSVQDLSQGGSYTQQVVKSYVDVVSTPIVLSPVIRKLGLATTPANLADRITADAPVDTVVINISARAATGIASARIANAVATELALVVDQLSPSTPGTSAVRLTTVQAAVARTDPISPRIPLNGVLGALIGGILATAAAALQQRLDTRLRTASDVYAASSLPGLGQVYFDTDAKLHPLVVQESPRSMHAEAFRGIRTNLRFVRTTAQHQAIVATSTLPGEGKTTSILNLAIAIAATGSSVCVVDADLRRPRIASYMGLESTIGLTDCIIGVANVDDALQHWGTDGLVVLPAGTIPPNPSELLQSPGAERLIQHLRERFDTILIDAPPLLPVTDAALISKFVDGAVIFAAVGRVRRGDLRHVLSTLSQIDTNLFGVIATMVPVRSNENYAYSAYYGASNKAIDA